MLKQTPQVHRALFLRLFTAEVISNVRKELIRQRKIEHKQKKKEQKELAEEIKKPIEIKKEILIKKPKGPVFKKIEPMESSIMTPQARKMPLLRRYSMPALPLSQQMPVTLGVFGLQLGKLNPIVADNEVTMIECPGPEKFVVVKKAGRINFTRISINQKEIDEIINSFAERARIPLISGVFRASVGNLTISAVISEFVGSRFIISKASPYSILERRSR